MKRPLRKSDPSDSARTTRTKSVHTPSPECRALTGGFLAGPENTLVASVLPELVSESAESWRPARYVPILLHGPAGSGKTLLVNGCIAAFRNVFREVRPGTSYHRTVLRTTMSDLIHDYATAARRGTVESLRQSLQDASLLIVEDIEVLSERWLVQRELLRLVEYAQETGRSILLTSATPPRAWSHVLPMFVSRVIGGVSVPIVPPSRFTRTVLIRGWSVLENVPLTDDAVAMLAERYEGVVPIVEGAVRNRFRTLKRMDPRFRSGSTVFQNPVTAEELDRISDSLERPLPTVHEIAKATARYFGVRLLELRGKSRMTRVATARHCAVALADGLCGRSLHEIGRYFSGRNHTTVAHSCRRVQELILTEPEIRDAMRALRATFD